MKDLIGSQTTLQTRLRFISYGCEKLSLLLALFSPVSFCLALIRSSLVEHVLFFLKKEQPFITSLKNNLIFFPCKTTIA